MLGGLMGMFDPENADQLAMALSLLGAKKGDNLGVPIQQFANAQMRKKQLAQQEAMQKMQMERGSMEMDQMRRQMAEQEALRGAAGQAFRPPVEPQGPMPDGGNMPMIPGGGGMPDFAQRAMAINPMVGMQYLPKPQAPKFHNVNGNLVQEPTKPGEMAKPVFTAPREPKDWENPAYQKFMMDKARAGRSQVTTNVMPQREIFKDSLSLKKDFDGLPEVKGFKEVQGAWDQISTALQNPSPANDLAAATKFMKLLDPGSVVRESELMMAMQASGALDRMANLGNRVLKGHKLTPEQRRDFYSAGEALYRAAGERFGQSVQQYEGIADQYGLDKQFIPKQRDRAAQNLKVNQTALYKAREAIKRGADPEAVKQRLMEQGYDPKGL